MVRRQMRYVFFSLLLRLWDELMSIDYSPRHVRYELYCWAGRPPPRGGSPVLCGWAAGDLWCVLPFPPVAYTIFLQVYTDLSVISLVCSVLGSLLGWMVKQHRL